MAKTRQAWRIHRLQRGLEADEHEPGRACPPDLPARQQCTTPSFLIPNSLAQHAGKSIRIGEDERGKRNRNTRLNRCLANV